jgi:diaminopimelate epimerase
MGTAPLTFYKLVAAGNDFVVVDNRKGHETIALAADQWGGTAESLCRRHFGIGADGFMLLGDPKSEEAAFSMTYYNADGSHGAACGNGARSLAFLAHQLGIYRSDAAFDTDAGLYHVMRNQDGTFTMKFSPGQFFERQLTLDDLPEVGLLDWMDTGVPHVVCWAGSREQLQNIDIVGLGKKLRHHDHFAPAGTNANFVTLNGRPTEGADNADEVFDIYIRTYERGVENETLGCGTGCIAATASLLSRRGMTNGSACLHTASGDVLAISLQLDGDIIDDVALTGKAALVYTGTLPFDSNLIPEDV